MLVNLPRPYIVYDLDKLNERMHTQQFYEKKKEEKESSDIRQYIQRSHLLNSPLAQNFPSKLHL